LKSLDELPALAELREMEPEPLLDPDDAPVPAHLQALADASLGDEEVAEPKDETSFRSLLVELDAMEEGLKIDFDDLREDEPEASV
ncbi:SMC-Scp complex subunit ScpB, partial [Pseudomonas sp. SIMBA_065]